MRVTSKGQVTIPQAIRESLKILPNTEVEFIEENGRVYLSKAANQSQQRGVDLIQRLRGKASVAMTTDEIMGLLRDD